MNNVLEAVVLCGGLGARLRQVIGDRPKAMVEVRGRPFVEWPLLYLRRVAQIQHIVFAAGYFAPIFECYFGPSDWNGAKLSYSREPDPLGTGGGLRSALPLTTAPRLLVLNGDTFCRYDIHRLVTRHVRTGAMASLWLARQKEFARYGNVRLDPEGRVTAFTEKTGEPLDAIVSAGVYLIERDIVLAIPEGRSVSLERDIFPSLVGRGLYGVVGEASLIDIGTPDSLLSADRAIADELAPLGWQ